MQRKGWLVMVIFLVLVLLTFGVSRAAPTLLDLPWFSVDGGGGRSSGGSYTMEGVIGQPDAGVLSGGSYSLSGGYLQPDGEVEYTIYLPLVIR